MSLLQVTIC